MKLFQTKFFLLSHFPLLFAIVLLLQTVVTYAQPNILYLNSKKVQPDSTFKKAKQLLDKALLNNDIQTAGICYQQLGDIFYRYNAMPQALDYYYKADASFTKTMDNVNYAINLNKIGRIYFKNANNTQALLNFKTSLNFFKRKEYIKGIAESYGNIGQVYEKAGVHDSSSKYQALALLEFKKINDKKQIAYTYSKLGSIHEDKAEYDTALKYFLLAYKLYKKGTSRIEEPGVLNDIGDTYRKMGKVKEALVFSRTAEKAAQALNDKRQLSSAHRDLAKTYNLLGKYDSAYYYSEKAREAYAQTFNIDNKKQLNLLQTLFEVQKKDNEILRLGNDKRVSEILTISISAIGLLIMFLGFSVYSRQQLKIRKNKILYETQNKAMELELHNKHLHQESLKAELELKSKELTTHTLHIIHKNQFLDQLKNELKVIVKDDKRDQRKEIKQLITLINENNDHDKNWEDFKIVFENVHERFFEKLKERCTSLTTTDLRFLALSKMNFSSSDIATMLGISQDSLRTTRYRVRKKLQLVEDENLSTYIQGL